MLIQLLFSSPIAFFILVTILVAAFTIHEFAHAWVADYLGDPTPRANDRVSLNPLDHLDPLGSLALLFVGFGWGKPVPFDPYNLKNPIQDGAKIALAGPLSNLLIAIILGIIYKLGLLNFLSFIPVIDILSYAITINVVLAVFNLLPVHPLDGEKIAVALLPRATALEFQHFMHRYGTYILLFLILPWGGVSPLSRLISPVIDWVLKMLI